MAIIACLFFFLQFENFVASLVAHVSHIQEQYGAEVTENYETTCWGCGLRVLLPSCASIFKCGWCGAITDQNKKKRDQKCFRWRILRDRCFVSVVIIFMFFVICKSVVSAISIFFLLSSFLTRLAFVFLWGLGLFFNFPSFSIFSLFLRTHFIKRLSSIRGLIDTFKSRVDGMEFFSCQHVIVWSYQFRGFLLQIYDGIGRF